MRDVTTLPDPDDNLDATLMDDLEDEPHRDFGFCPHGVDLDREYCPDGCRV